MFCFKLQVSYYLEFAAFSICFRTHLLFFGERQEGLERLHLVGLERSLFAVVDGDDGAAAVLLFDLLRGLKEIEKGVKTLMEMREIVCW